MTKSNKLIAIVAIALVGVFAVSFLTITTSTNTAYASMPSNGYSYDSHEGVYIDYSGRGTSIQHAIAKGEDPKVSANDIQIPYYQGQYEAKALDWWWLHSYSAWSPSYKDLESKNDPYIYRGERATEYDVQKGTEYLYQRYESRDVYDTKYHTTYQGTKWYNCWIVLFTEKWDGYEGQRANYKVIKRWTTQEKRGTTQVLVQDSTWRTSAPFSWAWENKWSAYSSRTSYRYRSRSLKWNPNSNVQYEKTPMNYALYNKNGEPMYFGLRWELEPLLTKKTGFLFINRNDASISDNTRVIQYYVPYSAILNEFKDDIHDVKDLLMSEHLDDDIGASIGGFAFEGFIALLVKAGCKAATNFSKLGLLVSVIGLYDTFNTKFTQAKLLEFINVIDSLSASNEVMIITVERTVNYPLYPEENDGVFMASTDMNACGVCIIPPMITPSNTRVDIVKSKDISYVSMKYDAKRAKNLGIGLGFHDDKPEYGKISYISSYSEILDYIELYAKGR